MTTPTADPPAPPPAPDAAPVADAPAHPAPQGLLAATAVIATIGVVVALLGIGLLLRPVQTPTQDCGTSLAFLLDGRVDVLVSETDPPAGITPAEAKANNAEPCRERVAQRAKPAAVLFGAGMLAALAALITEVSVRSRGRMRRRRAAREAQPAQPAAP